MDDHNWALNVCTSNFLLTTYCILIIFFSLKNTSVPILNNTPKTCAPSEWLDAGTRGKLTNLQASFYLVL